MRPRWQALTAWAVVLVASSAPDILWNELIGGGADWMHWVRLDLVGGVALAGFVWRGMRSLRDLAAVLFVTLIAQGVLARAAGSPGWSAALADAPSGRGLPEVELVRLGVAFIVIAALIALGYGRRDFFLVRGQLDAPSRPLRWLGLSGPAPWTRVGLQIAVLLGFVVLSLLAITARLAPATMLHAARLLPYVLPLAATRAFSEEMIYRAPLIATLEGPIGKRHALWMSTWFFAFGHEHVLPFVPIGVLVWAFAGWLLGRSMLETRGLFWAWLIHFVLDALVLSFVAAGSIGPA